MNVTPACCCCRRELSDRMEMMRASVSMLEAKNAKVRACVGVY